MNSVEFYLIMTVTLYTCISLCLASHAVEYKCCPREEWEGKMHLSSGAELNYYDFLIYTNGTIHIAYSVPLQKIYLGMQLVQNSSYLPQGTPVNVTQLYDFEVGILYEVSSGDSNCSKSPIPMNHTEQCIPADAKLLTTGSLGDHGSVVSTFRFKVPLVGLDYHITATVQETEIQSTCDPVHVIYATDVEADIGGILYSLDIFDVGPLKSPAIFKVPKQCLQ